MGVVYALGRIRSNGGQSCRMTPKSKSHFRRRKNFLLHKAPKLRRFKEWRRLPVVQLNLIENEVDYSSNPIASEEMRSDELEYINIFHKTNDQPLIWIKESEYKVKKRLYNN